jgi:uncharacterized protein YbjT (DUF2867 family)
MKAFVAGATGETGRRIVAELLDQNIPVRALVRDLTAARSILPPEVELVLGDVLQPETLRSGIGDSTVILCATGAKPSLDPFGPYRVDFEGTKNLVDVAQEKGIQHFVLVTSLCVSQFFHPLNLFWLILVWKKQAEDYLVKSNLTYTIVRPGGLKNEDYPAAIVMQSADTIFEGSIPRQKVAQVCVEALAEPESRHKIVEIVAEPGMPQTDLKTLFASVC